ncbi:hypothetical protein [Micromonospora sp. NBC_01796]|uniref:hypothetical protein n=1 Tax=Micromonospora sp. NBC_01796 TaxID=2975987 RepID=UPI002DDB0727|nr:hypothetical protein [Micromonospora sp. NBC_01796]WSA88063.1 hypothetical protein OIE47_10880 [Micromonospora sp. NBC_01796]
MADTIAETVDLLYGVDQDNLTVDQQISLSQAYATLAQAEQLHRMNEHLHGIHQILSASALRAATDGTAR